MNQQPVEHREGWKFLMNAKCTPAFSVCQIFRHTPSPYSLKLRDFDPIPTGNLPTEQKVIEKVSPYFTISWSWIERSLGNPLEIGQHYGYLLKWGKLWIWN